MPESSAQFVKRMLDTIGSGQYLALEHENVMEEIAAGITVLAEIAIRNYEKEHWPTNGHQGYLEQIEKENKSNG